MKIFDRYLIRSFIGPLILTFLIVVFVLMMQFLWLYIDDLVGKGLGFKVIMEFMMWGSATLIPLALPLATLLASIMTLGGLGENNELLAMKAAGVSLQRILLPINILAIFICIGAFFASNNLIPVAYKNIYALRDDIAHTKEEIRIPDGIFYNGIDYYTIRVESTDKETDMMRGITIYNHHDKPGNTSVTLADSGSIALTSDKANLIVRLHKGYSYEEGNRKSHRDTSYPMQRFKFDYQEVVIPLENRAFQRGDEGRFGNEIMAQNLKSLGHRRDSLDSLYTAAKISFRNRITQGTGFAYAYQADTAHNKNVHGIFPLDSLPEYADDQERLEAMRQVSDKLDQLTVYIDGFVMEDIQYNNPLRKTSMEWFRKFTLSFACLIFFFIGAPLGAIIRKGGLGTPTVVSLFFFVIYWVVDISGKKMGNSGSMSPAMGAWISTLVLLPMGIFLTWKATTDSALFNAENYLKFFRKAGRFLRFQKQEKVKAKIVFMGTPDFAVGVLDHLIKNGYYVCCVVTAPDKPAGRGGHLQQSPVKQYAVEHNLRCLQPVSLKDPQFIEDLALYQADIFAVVAFRMLPAIVWKMPVSGCFNLHASLLPQYRGAAPINWALINGETQTGITTFLLDKEIDTGAILLQESVTIAPEDHFGSLHDKLLAAAGPLTARTIDLLETRKAKSTPQPQTEPALRPAPKLNKETGHLHFSQGAAALHNRVRGLSPYPAAYARLCQIGGENTPQKPGDTKTQDLKIFASRPILESHNIAPGTLMTDGTTLRVACADGYLELLEVQLPGKRRLPAKDFLRGFRNPTAYQCV